MLWYIYVVHIYLTWRIVQMPQKYVICIFNIIWFVGYFSVFKCWNSLIWHLDNMLKFILNYLTDVLWLVDADCEILQKDSNFKNYAIFVDLSRCFIRWKMKIHVELWISGISITSTFKSMKIQWEGYWYQSKHLKLKRNFNH